LNFFNRIRISPGVRIERPAVKGARMPIYLFSVFIFAFFGLMDYVLADDDRYDYGKNERHQKRKRYRNKNQCKPITNPTYKATCEGCHLPYPPQLLPAASWKKILDRSNDHFGEQIPLDSKSKEVIVKYLSENGTDRSSCKKAVKIMESLKGKTPLRITEVPYIQKKHRKISQEVLNRKSIGSLSNCRACHKTAEQGVFDDHSVVIPQ
jgi:hypothetical protein